MKKVLLVLSCLSLMINMYSTTWADSEHKCPICKHKNNFHSIMSYGGYIYNWDTKYQFVFWPFTEREAIYSCLECHFTTLMYDFDSIPNNKILLIKNYLKGLNLDWNKQDYIMIPSTQKLKIAENIYRFLDKDYEFWCLFYRIQGYHYDIKKQYKLAMDSRFKCLLYAHLMLNKPELNGKNKEILYIIAAMNHYTYQDKPALFYLDKAKKLKFNDPKMSKDDIDGTNAYLDKLILEYPELIKLKK